MDKRRLDEWLRWAGDHALDFLKKNWRVLLAMVVAGSIGAAGGAEYSRARSDSCEDEVSRERELCVLRIDRCLDWMSDK